MFRRFRVISVVSGSLFAMMLVSLSFGEFRYCSAPVGPNPAAPQGCQKLYQSVGIFSAFYFGTWLTGDVIMKCDSAQVSDGCYDYPFAESPSPTCNRTQISCGGASLWANMGGGCTGYPLGMLNPVVSYNAGFNPATDVNCNNVYWLQATGGMANGVNCSAEVPGLF